MIRKLIKSFSIFFLLLILTIVAIYLFFFTKPERIIYAVNRILDNQYSIQFQSAESYTKLLSPEFTYTNIKIIDDHQKEIFKADEIKIGISLLKSIINNFVYLNLLHIDNIEVIDNFNSGNVSNEFKYKIENLSVGSEEFTFSSKRTEIINKKGYISVFNLEGTLNNLPYSQLSIFKKPESNKYLFKTRLSLDESIIENEKLLDLSQFTNPKINLNIETKGSYNSETGNISSLNKYIFSNSSLLTSNDFKIDKINSVLFTNLDEKTIGIFSAKIPGQNIDGSIIALDERIILQSNITVNMEEIVNYGKYLNLKGNENFYVKLTIEDKISLELNTDLNNTVIRSNLTELLKNKNENLETRIYISDMTLPTYFIENNKFSAFIDDNSNGYFSLGNSFDNEIKKINFTDGFYIYLELDNLKIDDIFIENNSENVSNLKFIKLKIKQLDFFNNSYENQSFEINFRENETYASFNGKNLNGNLKIDSSGFSRIDVFDTKFEFKGIDMVESNDSLKFDDINLRFVGRNIQTFNDTFQDVDFYLLRNKKISTVDNIRISSENINIGPTKNNEKAYISYDKLNDLYKLKGSYEITNKNDLFRDLINYDFEYLFSDLNIQWKSINQLKELEGRIKFKLKDLEYDTNLPDSSLITALKILNLNALIDNFSNDSIFDESNLIINRAEGDFYVGKNRALLNKPIKLETAEAKMSWTGQIIKNKDGLLDQLDLDLQMRLKVSENIPWYAAIFGGIPALAGGFVFENIIDERLDNVSTFNFNVTGSINDPKINRLD